VVFSVRIGAGGLQKLPRLKRKRAKKHSDFAPPGAANGRPGVLRPLEKRYAKLLEKGSAFRRMERNGKCASGENHSLSGSGGCCVGEPLSRLEDGFRYGVLRCLSTNT